MANPSTLLNLYCLWIRDNYIKLTVEKGHTYRELVEQAARGALHRIRIEFLSPTLDEKTLVRGRVVFGYPHDFFNEIAAPDINTHGSSLGWWITERGLTIADNPPQGVFYVDAHGYLRNKKHQRVPVRRRGWPIRYQSKLKQAILAELTKDPDAGNYKIACLLDKTVEVPASWRKSSFRSVYKAKADDATRHNLEVLISKVRNDLRERGPSPPILYRGVSLITPKLIVR